ncbi:MAG TPA: class I adenylate-forming enzyme family protein [Gemmatimonadaceae bacterium]
MNVGSLLARHARYRRDHLAVVCGRQRLSFGEVYTRVNRFANALLGMGLRKGDKLAIILPNCIELLDAYRACAQIGVVSVPLSPLLRGAGLVSLLRDSDSVAVLACPAVVEALDEARRELPQIRDDRYILAGTPVTPGYRAYDDLVASSMFLPPPTANNEDEDIYNIIYSSGTTGQPKGIIHTHKVRALYGSLFTGQFRVTPESVVLHAGSLVFNGAFVTLMAAWFTGCTFILQEKFDAAEFIETVHREKVTHVMMVPSQIVAVLNAPNFSAEKLRSLEMLCSVGAPWHREHKERMLAVLPTSLYELYGLTEGFITVLDRTDFARKIDSVGVPIAFTEMKIVDNEGRPLPAGEVGEIVGRSPLMMPGYYKRPDLTAQAIKDGWLFTGDLGSADEDGYLHLVDRKKDLIISGGVNVFPKDIEEIAVQHEAVREVAVFGVPHEKWGESPVAAVVLRSTGMIGAAELKTWINQRVAARYQQVNEVLILEDLPRSTAGKTLKRVLRDQYATLASPAPERSGAPTH